MSIDPHHLACLEAALDLALESPRGPDGALTPGGKAHVKAALDQANGPARLSESVWPYGFSEEGWYAFAAKNAGRTPGEKWQGPSGRWFTMRPDRRIVPTSSPDQDRARAEKGKAKEAAARAKADAAAKAGAAKEAAAKQKAALAAKKKADAEAKRKAAEEAKNKAAAAKEASARQAQQQRRQAAQHIRDVVSGGATTTPAKVRAAGAHLLTMTATELRALKSEIGAKGGGAAKAGLVAAITERALAARKVGKAKAAGKAKPVAAPAPAVKPGPGKEGAESIASDLKGLYDRASDPTLTMGELREAADRLDALPPADLKKVALALDVSTTGGTRAELLARVKQHFLARKSAYERAQDSEADPFAYATANLGAMVARGEITDAQATAHLLGMYELADPETLAGVARANGLPVRRDRGEAVQTIHRAAVANMRAAAAAHEGKGRAAPEAALPGDQQAALEKRRFTGTDRLGRKWVNGKLVAAEEKPATVGPPSTADALRELQDARASTHHLPHQSMPLAELRDRLGLTDPQALDLARRLRAEQGVTPETRSGDLLGQNGVGDVVIPLGGVQPRHKAPATAEQVEAAVPKVEAAVREAAAALPPGGQVKISDLRRQLGLGRHEFDSAMHALRRAGKVKLDAISNLQRAKPGELADAIPGVNETLFYVEPIGGKEQSRRR